MFETCAANLKEIVNNEPAVRSTSFVNFLLCLFCAFQFLYEAKLV